jgi:hypothetical protein
MLDRMLDRRRGGRRTTTTSTTATPAASMTATTAQSIDRRAANVRAEHAQTLPREVA